MNTSTPTHDAEVLADMERDLTAHVFPDLKPGTRCDADSAETATAQVLVNGSVLHFCSHHWRANHAVLSRYPHQVADEESKPFTWRRAQELSATSPAPASTPEDGSDP